MAVNASANRDEVGDSRAGRCRRRAPAPGAHIAHAVPAVHGAAPPFGHEGLGALGRVLTPLTPPTLVRVTCDRVTSVSTVSTTNHVTTVSTVSTWCGVTSVIAVSV